jgi:hypothetical protein
MKNMPKGHLSFLEARPKRRFFGNDLFWVGNRAVHDFINLQLTNNGLKQLAPAATQNFYNVPVLFRVQP